MKLGLVRLFGIDGIGLGDPVGLGQGGRRRRAGGTSTTSNAGIGRQVVQHGHQFRTGALALLLFALLLGCAPEPAPEPLLRRCSLQIQLTHRGAPAQIGVASSFADFAPLQRTQGDQWALDLPLPPGEHRYRVEIDGRPLLDPNNPLSVRHQGGLWSLIHAPDCSAPAWTLTERRYDHGPLYTLQLQRADATHGLDPATVEATVDGQPVPVQIEGDTLRFDARALPRGKHQFALRSADTAGRATEPFSAPFWVEPTPFRWRDALIYQVFTDRFAADTPWTPADHLRPAGARLGGNLRGLRAKLQAGYFEHLGVNTLWISPMNLNPDGLWPAVHASDPPTESYHAYWPIAPRQTDPRFGTAAELDALIAEAHQRGLRVLLDVVLNHVHGSHPYLAEHPEWFSAPGCYCGQGACDWGSHIETCWFTPDLPDVAWQHHAALTAFVDDTLWWVERFGFDGLRVDAVPMMPRFVTRALTAQLHARFEGLGARHALLGETFTGPNEHARIRWYLGPYGLDGQFDFPLMWALRQVFAAESEPVWHLADTWATSEAAWAGASAVMSPFIGNHDLPRFISQAAGHFGANPPIPSERLPYQKTLLALSFVLTAPGAPALYQGDAYGQPGADDPDNRRPTRFGGERTAHERWLFEHTARLGRLRRCLPSLRAGGLYPLRAEAERFIYARDAGDGAPAIVVLNRRPEPGPVTLQLPPDLPIHSAALLDVVSGQRFALDQDRRATLALSPHLPAVLIPADHACAQEPER
jgi:glycosidase